MQIHSFLSLEGNLHIMQVEHVPVANQTQVVTKDVVETAQHNLINGMLGAP